MEGTRLLNGESYSDCLPTEEKLNSIEDAIIEGTDHNMEETRFSNGEPYSDCSSTEEKLNSSEDSIVEGLLKQSEKENEIELFLSQKYHEPNLQYFQKLRNYALSDGGLIKDKYRTEIWPKLLHLEPENYEPLPSEKELESHHEYTQVHLDVDRSLKRFPPGIPLKLRVEMQDQLIRLILRVIIKYPQLQYYQGYHDVAITFLLVLGENVAFHIMEKLSVEHLKHFMEPTLDKTQELLNYIYPLLDHLHPALCEYIEREEVGTMFCLPWFLTWYSHNLTNYTDVVRLYDYFLASPPLLPLYLIPEIVVYRQDDIFNTPCDMACLHQVLSQLPPTLPFDELLQKATQLYSDYPPEVIAKEAKERINKKKDKVNDLIEQRKRYGHSGKRKRYWNLARLFPYWLLPVPYTSFRTFLITAGFAGFAAGLCAYLRYANELHNYISK